MLNLDKFYTPVQTAEWCISKILEHIPSEHISEWLEPSAGAGAFSNLVPNCKAYDILPEAEGIQQMDFLQHNLTYKQGRLIFGNPPFGEANNLARQFFKISVKLSDYIAFVLPISQYNNSDSMFDFDLIASYDLGLLEYSGSKVHCCFNIYRRPENGILNKRPHVDCGLFAIYTEGQKGYDELEYDFAIYRRGSSSGKLRTKQLDKQTYKIKVFDKSNVEYVKTTILNFDWKRYKKHQSAPSISKNDIHRIFLNKVDENGTKITKT